MIQFKLKEMAESKGLTMSDVMYGTRLSNVTVGSIWHNEATQREKILEKVCNFLGCNLSDILEIIPDDKPAT